MKTKIILASIILLAAQVTFAAPPSEEGTISAVKAQTDYLSLVLTNKALLVSSLALVAILIAALSFLVRVKLASSKTS